eukprot:364242-Chlamydomonas_euryale.AAC.3
MRGARAMYLSSKRLSLRLSPSHTLSPPPFAPMRARGTRPHTQLAKTASCTNSRSESTVVCACGGGVRVCACAGATAARAGMDDLVNGRASRRGRRDPGGEEGGAKEAGGGGAEKGTAGKGTPQQGGPCPSPFSSPFLRKGGNRAWCVVSLHAAGLSASLRSLAWSSPGRRSRRRERERQRQQHKACCHEVAVHGEW